MQVVALVSQTLLLLERVPLVLFFVEQNGVFCWPSVLQVAIGCWWKRGINASSQESVYMQLIFLLVDFNIVEIRQLIPAGVHILRTYTGKYLVPHFMCSLLVRGNWESRWMVVLKVLTLRQQQAPSCQKKPLESCCHFRDEIFYSERNWNSSKFEAPLNTVVGNWKNYFVLLLTKVIKIDTRNEFLVNCINHGGSLHVDAINGRISVFFGSGSEVVACDWQRNSFNEGDGSSFS